MRLQDGRYKAICYQQWGRHQLCMSCTVVYCIVSHPCFYYFAWIMYNNAVSICGQHLSGQATPNQQLLLIQNLFNQLCWVSRGFSCDISLGCNRKSAILVYRFYRIAGYFRREFIFEYFVQHVVSKINSTKLLLVHNRKLNLFSKS